MDRRASCFERPRFLQKVCVLVSVAGGGELGGGFFKIHERFKRKKRDMHEREAAFRRGCRRPFPSLMEWEDTLASPITCTLKEIS